MEDVYYKVLGTFLKLQRLQKHQTLEQVARAVGHSKGWYYDVERGKNRVYVKDCMKLCDYFGCSMNDLQAFLEGHNGYVIKLKKSHL
nr:helix-turn-helix transcriptional regulator [Catenibacterium mitsuokai]